MNQININKMLKIIIIGIILTLIISFVISTIHKNKPKVENNSNESITDNEVIQAVAPDEAEEIYITSIEKCSGVLVWNLKIGDTVEINDLEITNACMNEDEYYSKMVGYTYDELDNLIVHVNVLKNINNELYKLDDSLVGIYNESNIDALLDLGTTYVYTYQKKEDKYSLIKVEMMEI